MRVRRLCLGAEAARRHFEALLRRREPVRCFGAGAGLILDRTLSGLPAAEIANVSSDIVERIFRRNISMGKGMGLMAMVQAVQTLAKNASKP